MFRIVFIVTAFSLTSLVAMAQRDTTKQSVNITSTYKPVLRNAVKINFSGSQLLSDTSTSVKPYVIPAQNLFYSYQPIALKPLALLQDSNLYLGNRNYIKAGFGNYSTPFVKAALGLGDGKTILVNFFGSYISSKGKIKNQDYAQFNAKAAGSYFGKRTEAFGSASFSRHDFHLYGYDHAIYDYKRKEVKQYLQDITIQAGIRNTETSDFRINYNPNAELNIFTNIDQLNETTFRINVPVEKEFGENFALKVEPGADLTNYMTKGTIPNNYSFNNNVVQVAASVLYKTPMVKVNAGITPTWDKSKLELLPNIYGEVQLQENALVLQAGWMGRLVKNTARNLSEVNPYIAAPTSQTNTKEIEFYGGIKGNLGSHFGYNAKAGIVRYTDMPLFINDTSSDRKSFLISYEPTATNFRVHGDLSYIRQEKFTATAGVTFNGYTGFNVNGRAWNTVPVEISGSLRWWAFRQVMLKADYFMFGGGNYLDKGNLSYQFKPGSDLSLGAEFRINHHFSAWLDLNNVFNNRYERWHRYEVYGLNLLGGIRYDF